MGHARPLNVLHAIHDFLPRHAAGSEIYAASLCRTLAALGHHVTVVAAEYDPARPDGHVSWRQHEGVPVVEIVNNYRASSFEESYRPPLIARRLAHVLDVVRPALVHVHNLLNLSFDLPAMAHARGIGVVATLHDYTLVCPSGGQRLHRAEAHVCRAIDPDRCARCFRESPFYAQMAVAATAAAVPAPRTVSSAARWLARTWPAAASRAQSAMAQIAPIAVSADDVRARLAAACDAFDAIDLIVAPSKSLADEFIALGFAAEKMVVRDYGFETSDRQARTAPPASPLRFGFVGSIVWHKGLHILIDAARRLPSDRFRLEIFGDPAVSPAYADQLRRSAAGLPITFHGGFDPARAMEIYDELDVLVVPSIWLENSPLVIHEAFMSHVPVIGARMGGVADLVSDGENGLLYDAMSPDALADAMRSLIEHPNRVTQMSARVADVKSIETDAADWLNMYAGLIQRERP